MSKIKIAVVGVGGISGCHIKNYLNNPDVELYALCDIDEAKLKMKGEMYGVTRLYTDEDTMLRELPERDKSLIYFRYFKGMTQIKTAERLGMSQVQVSRREKIILSGMREKLN